MRPRGRRTSPTWTWLAEQRTVDLDPYVVTPLTEAEIAAVVEAVGRPVPDAIIEILQSIGHPQNVCYQLFRPHEYARNQELAPDGTFAFANFEDWAIDAVASDGTVVRVVHDEPGMEVVARCDQQGLGVQADPRGAGRWRRRSCHGCRWWRRRRWCCC